MLKSFRFFAFDVKARSSIRRFRRKLVSFLFLLLRKWFRFDFDFGFFHLFLERSERELRKEK